MIQCCGLRDQIDQLPTEAAAYPSKGLVRINRLMINEDKAQSLVCSLRRNCEEGKAVKLLRFWIYNKLNWTRHIFRVCVKLSRVLYLLRKFRTELPQPRLLKVFHALFHSHLAYKAWFCGRDIPQRLTLSCSFNKKVLRIMTHAGHLDHCWPILQGPLHPYHINVTSPYLVSIWI